MGTTNFSYYEWTIAKSEHTCERYYLRTSVVCQNWNSKNMMHLWISEKKIKKTISERDKM